MTSNSAYNLILKTGVSNLELETIISQSCYYSYNYAKDIIKGRFELGEEAISKDGYYSWCYTIEILKGRFELGEEAISKVSSYSYDYAIHVLNGRFKLGENTMKNYYDLVYYFIEVMRYNHNHD